MNFKDLLRYNIENIQETINSIRDSVKLLPALSAATDTILSALKNGNKLLLCGNGGSAADAQHIATEFVCRFFQDRRAFNAEALTVNTSSLTAISNDFSFNAVYSRQIEAKGVKNDVLIGISTSGTSKNILEAFSTARKQGLKTICFTGSKAPDHLDTQCDIVLRVPSSCTPRIQECHILLMHTICEYIETELCKTGM